MAILSGYMQRYTGVKTVGLCHSVQVCTKSLFGALGMENIEVGHELIAGINHMGWLLEIRDKNGNDLIVFHTPNETPNERRCVRNIDIDTLL
jgi:alpha-galactosidase